MNTEYVSNSSFKKKNLLFSIYRSLTSFVKFIPSYFILFVAMTKESFLKTSISEMSLLVYRSTVDFLH